MEFDGGSPDRSNSRRSRLCRQQGEQADGESQHQPATAGRGVSQQPPHLPGWGSITFQEPRGNSIYHGLQTKVEKRFSKGNMFLCSYTWAKAIDDSDSTQLSTTSGTGNLQDQRNLRGRTLPFLPGRAPPLGGELSLRTAVRQRPALPEHVVGVVDADGRRLADQRNHVLSERARLHDRVAHGSFEQRLVEYPARTPQASRPICRRISVRRSDTSMPLRLPSRRVRVWKHGTQRRHRPSPDQFRFLRVQRLSLSTARAGESCSSARNSSTS